MLTEEQFEKLPRYGRQEVERLRHELKEARDALALMTEGPNPAKGCRVTVQVGQTVLPLPDGARLMFTPWGGMPIEVRLSDGSYGPAGTRLLVRGLRNLRVLPFAANTIEVGTWCGECEAKS